MNFREVLSSSTSRAAPMSPSPPSPSAAPMPSSSASCKSTARSASPASSRSRKQEEVIDSLKMDDGMRNNKLKHLRRRRPPARLFSWVSTSSTATCSSKALARRTALRTSVGHIHFESRSAPFAASGEHLPAAGRWEGSSERSSPCATKISISARRRKRRFIGSAGHRLRRFFTHESLPPVDSMIARAQLDRTASLPTAASSSMPTFWYGTPSSASAPVFRCRATTIKDSIVLGGGDWLRACSR